MPSRLDHSPSCMWPPAARAASSQCWARVTPRAQLAYSMARRMSRVVLHAGAVVGEQAHPEARPARPSAPAARPARPTVMAPADTHVAERRRRRARAPAGDHAARVDGRVGVGHGHHRGVAAERRGPAAGLDRLGRPLRPGSRRWVCRSTRPGRDDAPGGVEHDGPGGRRRCRASTAAMHAALDDRTSAASAPGRVDDLAAPDDQRVRRPLTPGPPARAAVRRGRHPSRAAGTAPPCAPRTPLAHLVR